MAAELHSTIISIFVLLVVLAAGIYSVIAEEIDDIKLKMAESGSKEDSEACEDDKQKVIIIDDFNVQIAENSEIPEQNNKLIAEEESYYEQFYKNMPVPVYPDEEVKDHNTVVRK